MANLNILDCRWDELVQGLLAIIVVIPSMAALTYMAFHGSEYALNALSVAGGAVLAFYGFAVWQKGKCA